MRAPLALVLGGADCLWRDVELAGALLGEPDVIVACNDAGWLWPGRLDHWCSLHTEKFPEWIPRRSGPGDFTLWYDPEWSDEKPVAVYKGPKRTLRIWRTRDGGTGSSGLLAVQVALEVAEKVVLCGIPMDRRPHVEGSTDGNPGDWPHAEPYREAWERHLVEMEGRVKSMSGWTAHLLGMPTRAWGNSQQERAA